MAFCAYDVWILHQINFRFPKVLQIMSQNISKNHSTIDFLFFRKICHSTELNITGCIAYLLLVFSYK